MRLCDSVRVFVYDCMWKREREREGEKERERESQSVNAQPTGTVISRRGQTERLTDRDKESCRGVGRGGGGGGVRKRVGVFAHARR